jgi:hypothetical protein
MTDQATTSERRLWAIALVACAAAVAVQAGFAPLSDPDLPNHLATGKWIVAHRAVPFVEPFAWTRSRAPFFAYSWLVQVVMYLLFHVLGPLGLHLLAGIAAAGVTFAGAAAARALGATPAASVAFGVASAIVAMESTPFVRPQLFMHALVPLAWVCVARIRRDTRPNAPALVALLLVSALAANVHITFPVMAAPLVLLVLEPGWLRDRRLWLAGGAVAVGWLVSPYGLVWPDVFRLNFARNAITTYPAPTGELTPGFVIAPLVGVLLAALPLVALPMMRSARERAWYGAMWLAGLFVFARMFKGLGPWWWCATPMTVLALSRLPRASDEGMRRVYAGLLVVALCASAIPNVRFFGALSRYEIGVDHGALPSIKGYSSEPAARWLERNLREDARGRLLTTFSYGSYLQWRLPTLSVSIDGRTIFPDSAALPDALAEGGRAALGPWKSADLAVVPVTYPVARMLDSAPDWVKIGDARPSEWATNAAPVGLWVRRSWWDRSHSGTRIPPDGTERVSP